MSPVSLRVASDLAECEALWRRLMPRELLSDLWEFRLLFHRWFERPLHFVVLEERGEVMGFLPLCRAEETGGFCYFPGELWHGKTWIEQNRVLAADGEALARLLAAAPGPHHVRYLLPLAPSAQALTELDEVGYLFHPADHGFSFDAYWETFSGKTRKRMGRELAAIEALGVEFVRDTPGDFERMAQMNLSRFGEHSYFHDPRFLGSFRDVAAFLEERGWLRTTAARIGGVDAAIDVGCLREGTYTLLAGGTREEFPGVAKLINLHHLRRACEERMREVDFLCGEFNWKDKFHLTPRPLYMAVGHSPG